MKKVVSIVLVLVLVFSLATLSGCGSEDQVVLNVYNWGMNIAEGEDGYIDVIAEFEEKYPDIDVNYTTYEDNESLYTRLKNGGATYDVIIPSDYMIARMIEEDMLLPLNFENIPNYELVDDSFKNQAYDPNNEYSVPYTWGTVGVIYNTKYVDEADVGGWDLLWNEKYADRIQQHLDAKEESFSIDVDNQSFPPSISGIQNGTVAYAMNQREWKVQGAKVELTAASNVTKESNSKWSARYDLAAKYRIATLEKVIDDGSYRLAAALDARMAVSASASGCSLSSGAGALSLERDGATGLYRVSSGGLMLTESGNRAVLAEADGSASQLWRVSALGGGRYSFTSASGLALDDRGQRTSEGNTVWLYEPNGGPAQAWVLT